jgi:hypothetical protein
MGGEEFLVICHNSPSAAALPIANHLIGSWRQTAPPTTISAGVAIHPHGQSPLTTYAQADAALYAAKNAGRDQAVMAAEAPADLTSERRNHGQALPAGSTEVPSPRSTARSPAASQSRASRSKRPDQAASRDTERHC